MFCSIKPKEYSHNLGLDLFQKIITSLTKRFEYDKYWFGVREHNIRYLFYTKCTNYIYIDLIEIVFPFAEIF